MLNGAARGRATFRDNENLFVSREDLVDQLEALKGDSETPAREVRRQRRTLTADLDRVTMDILEANAGLVHKYATKFCGLSPEADAEDHVAAGFEGLLQAVRSYRTTGGASFSRWAFPFIKRAVLASVRAHDFPYLSSADFDKRPAILEAAQALQGTRPEGHADPAEVAALVDVPEAMVRRVLEPPTVLRMYGGPSQEQGDAVIMHLPDPAVDVQSEALRHNDLDVLTDGLRQLDDLELFMVVRKYGLDGEPAQLSVDLSRMTGVSRQRVRDLLDSGLSKLASPGMLQKVVG